MAVFIIAEAGVNHNGSIENAKKLIDMAAIAGADAVKFQTFQTENLVCRNAQKASYQIETTDKKESQFQMLKKLELSESMHRELIEYSNKRSIMFLSTPFDIESAYMLKKIGVKVFKIPSGEITNLPYLRVIAELGEKIILSTGMCSLDEVMDAVEILKKNGSNDISVLHCNTEYPTPMQDVNLRAMITLQEKLQLPVGFSDHTRGIEIPIAAVALGAEIIEKHFTLDRNMEGPDHKASLEPEELKKMVEAIRNVENALGNGIKKPSQSELKNREIVRKSIVAKIEIREGETFSEKNITTKRPGNGISPMLWDKVIGKQAKHKYSMDEMIEL